MVRLKGGTLSFFGCWSSTMFSLFYNLHGCALLCSWFGVTQSSLSHFPGCQCSCGIILNRPVGSVVSLNICRVEVLGCRLDTDYVISMLELRPFLNHSLKLQQLLGRTLFSKLVFWMYSQRHRYITPAALSPKPEAPSWIFLAERVIFRDAYSNVLWLLTFLCCHYINSHITYLTVSFKTAYAYVHSH